MPLRDIMTGEVLDEPSNEVVRQQSRRQVGAAQAQPASPDGMEGVHDFPSAAGHLGKQFGTGALASLHRTYLGLKQAATYIGGDSAARQAINDEIARMEQEYGPALKSPAGKIGEVAGTVAQFVGPGMVAGAAGKAFPAAANALRTVTGAPGSIQRAAVTAGAFEGAQPVQPGNTDTEDFAVQKGGRVAAGAALGAGAGWLANRLTRPGPEITPELRNLVKQAEAAGFKGKAALTPAQRTQDRYLLQKEEGLLSSPGSSNLIADKRKAQQEVIDQAAAKAMGYPGKKPTEAVFGAARDNANMAYEPIAKIKKLNTDVTYFDALHDIAKTSKSRDVARVARQVRETGSLPGDAFLEHLQDIRTMGTDAGAVGQQYTAKEFGRIGKAMEEFLERKLTQEAAKPGNVITGDTLKAFREARTQHSAIRALERSTDPIRGMVNPNKVLSEQFRRQRPGSTPSPTTKKLSEVADAARVMRQTMPYIGSSGTAERQMGQKIVEAESSPMSAIRFAIPSVRNYLAAKHYLANGASPGALNSLHPGVKELVRRGLPPAALGSSEALAE